MKQTFSGEWNKSKQTLQIIVEVIVKHDLAKWKCFFPTYLTPYPVDIIHVINFYIPHFIFLRHVMLIAYIYIYINIVSQISRYVCSCSFLISSHWKQYRNSYLFFIEIYICARFSCKKQRLISFAWCWPQTCQRTQTNAYKYFKIFSSYMLREKIKSHLK